MTDLASRTIAEIGASLRGGALHVRDVVEHCLDREAATRSLNAYVEVFAKDALALADAHQSLLDTGYDLGPLHGIPIALKANIDVQGKVVHAGSRILKDRVAPTDATVVTRLKQAGSILLGFTNMHEFAWGGTTENPHYGPCRNAWDPERIPAGSSGGSGAAVAAGSAVAALGTDTGGSVRLPASMNGVTGLRPGVGRIPTNGVFPLAWSMDTVGPIAASAQDCRLLFEALAADRSGAPAEPEMPLARLDGLRIGVLRDYSFTRLQPDIERAMRETVDLLASLGARIAEICVTGLETAVDAQVIVDACEPSAVHASWIGRRAEDYGEDVRILLQAGLTFTAVEYIQAQRYRTMLRSRFDRAFREVDAVLTPTLPFTAPRIGEDRVAIGDEEESTLTGNMRFTCIPSLTGLPAVSFPIGFDDRSLPIGAQLMGAENTELHLCDIVERLHRAGGVRHRRPSGAGRTVNGVAAASTGGFASP